MLDYRIDPVDRALGWIGFLGPVLLAVIAIVTWPANGEEQSIRVIDGDTFAITDDITDERIRLFGIDAPESDEPCGTAATAALEAILEQGPLVCRLPDTGQDRDRYGRLVRVCEVDGMDIAAALVARGLAEDWPRYSGGAYAEPEAVARDLGLGIWGGCE